jgi:hypothetical protein
MENNEDQEISFDEIVEASVMPASKGPLTNALVHNPFTYADDNAEE